MKKKLKTILNTSQENKSIKNEISSNKLKIELYKAKIKVLKTIDPNIDVNKRLKQINEKYKRDGLTNQISIDLEQQLLLNIWINKGDKDIQSVINEQITKFSFIINKLELKQRSLYEKHLGIIKPNKVNTDKKSKILKEKKSDNEYLNKDPYKTPSASINDTPIIPNFSTGNINSINVLNTKISWDLVSFGPSEIIINFKGSYFTKYIPESKKYFNEIKSIYKFRNAPELEVKLLNGKILEIKNEDVLFFYINFLPDCFTIFNQKSAATSVSKWKIYTKSYYRDKLRFLWINKSLEYLCELSDANTPIVPAPELIRNRNGKEEINNSFIFPIRNQNGNTYLFWESIEDSKATYVFNAEEKYDIYVQNIFDFIIGKLVNKRETLIADKELQKALKFERRIYHNNFADWKSEINKTLGKL